jgi:hypothetical protein
MPDSLVFLQTLPVDKGGRTAAVYFFKYKRKRDDSYWKIASVGPVFHNDGRFEEGDLSRSSHEEFDLTEFSNTRLKDDLRIETQLGKKLSELLLSQTRGGRLFYQDEDEEDYSVEMEDPGS